MKEIMSSCPVLSLPDFSNPFVVECDASCVGIGAILMQDRHPIAFERRKLQPHERMYSIYDKECWPSWIPWSNSDSTWWEVNSLWRLITTVLDTSLPKRNSMIGNKNRWLRFSPMILKLSIKREKWMLLLMHSPVIPHSLCCKCLMNGIFSWLLNILKISLLVKF